MASVSNAMIIEAKKLDLIAAGVIGKSEEIHTYQHWKTLGYRVRKGEHAVARFKIWKHVTKRTHVGEFGDFETETSGKLILANASFFSEKQVDLITKEVA